MTDDQKRYYDEVQTGKLGDILDLIKSDLGRHVEQSYCEVQNGFLDPLVRTDSGSTRLDPLALARPVASVRASRTSKPITGFLVSSDTENRYCLAGIRIFSFTSLLASPSRSSPPPKGSETRSPFVPKGTGLYACINIDYVH